MLSKISTANELVNLCGLCQDRITVVETIIQSGNSSDTFEVTIVDVVLDFQVSLSLTRMQIFGTWTQT